MSNRQRIDPLTPPTVDAAQAAIANLTTKRDTLLERGDELATIRASVAFKALSEDDAVAKQKLDQINRESVSHSHELASVDAALVTAKQRLEAAQRHEAKAFDREKAKALRAQLAQFVAAAQTLDDCLDLMVTTGDAMRDIVTEVNRLGLTHPSHAQLDSLGGIALRSSLMLTPWSRHFERVSIVEKKTFSGLVAAWSPMVERQIAALEQTETIEAAK
jgi:hypothetical protein